MIGSRKDAGPLSMNDARFMRLALSLGRRGLGNTWPNPAVGCVNVNDDVMVGRGWTQPGGRPHAETEALLRAGPAARGATLYATLEPCSHHGRTPPCADAIIAAGIARVVSALEDVNPEVAGQGHARLRAAGVTVEVGVCAQEARRAHAGHIRRIKDRRPHLTLKLAVSADGKAGLAGRKPVAITGEAARDRVHMMRAMNDAVLTGIGTALADDPALTCRLPGMAERSPVRVVLDSSLRLPADGRLARTAGETPVWAFAGPEASADAERGLAAVGAKVFRVAAGRKGIDPEAALQALAEQGVTRLMVEAGPRLAASFLAADLVDEAALLRSPKEIGKTGIDAVEGRGIDALIHSLSLKSLGTAPLGADIIEWFERV
jgi:diaminohydroxyphosphoribosylaminopyrimidine deaminase/5-amino-6-(5-phosphoribosylamino)uracil reductase